MGVIQLAKINYTEKIFKSRAQEFNTIKIFSQIKKLTLS